MMRTFLFMAMTMGLLRAEIFAGEALPPRALARLGDHRFYHGPGIHCLALSPDGKLVASAASCYSFHLVYATQQERAAHNRLVIVWDTETGKRLRELRLPRGAIAHLAFSSDGKRLAVAYLLSGEKAGLHVFEVASGKSIWHKSDFNRPLASLRFFAEDKQLGLSEWRGPVSAWDAATGKQVHLWKPPTPTTFGEEKSKRFAVRGMLSPDGQKIVWEMIPRDEVKDRIAVGLRVHDVDTDQVVYQKNLFSTSSPERFAFSADGKRLAAYRDKLYVWETATGKERAAIEVPRLLGFALMPEGKRAAICQSDSRTLRMWDLHTGKASRDLLPGFVPLHSELLAQPQLVSADGKTLLIATHATLRLLDTNSGQERVLSEHRAAISPHFSADGRTLFTSCAERRCCWDVAGKKPSLLASERRNDWEIDCLAHGAGGIFLDCRQARLRLRETATGRVVRELTDAAEADPDIHLSACFAPDASRVLLRYSSEATEPIGYPLFFRLYETKTGKKLAEIKPAKTSHLVFSPHGRLLAGIDHESAIHLYDAITGKSLRILRSSRPLFQTGCEVSPILFTPDGEKLIVNSYVYDRFKPTGEGETMLPTRVFSLSSGREIFRFYSHPNKGSKSGPLSYLACSPNNRLLAIAEEDSGIVRLLEIDSGKVRAEFAGHRHGVHSLDFSPDGKTLASGGEDNVVYLWDVTGAKTLPQTKTDLAAWWNDLASDDGKRAGEAIAAFLRKPAASAAFLQEKLRPAQPLDRKRLAQWIADLDADAFETREAASRELIRLGERAETSLRRELTKRPSLEMRRRIENVLSKLEPGPLPPETLRTLRAIEVLEHIGNPAARRWLEALTKGDVEARQTHAAKAALQRLGKRP